MTSQTDSSDLQADHGDKANILGTVSPTVCYCGHRGGRGVRYRPRILRMGRDSYALADWSFSRSHREVFDDVTGHGGSMSSTRPRRGRHALRESGLGAGASFHLTRHRVSTIQDPIHRRERRRSRIDCYRHRREAGGFGDARSSTARSRSRVEGNVCGAALVGHHRHRLEIQRALEFDRSSGEGGKPRGQI